MARDTWSRLATEVLEGRSITRQEALALLRTTDDDLLPVLDAAYCIRHRHFGRGVRLHVLRSAVSGGCSEDCGFCGQSSVTKQGSGAATSRLTREAIIEGARHAHAMKAIRYCIASSGRGPTTERLADLCDTVRAIKAEVPIQICVSLGLLDARQAQALKAAGVNRYNHNLEASERHFPRICTTHAYQDRVATARRVKEAGLELCCGGLLGTGEDDTDRVELAFALKEAQADSIPVNFLDPRPGTPLAAYPRPRPTDCLRTLAMFRFVHPSTEVRIAGGREVCLGPLQALALYPANSMFTGNYLTTAGQGHGADLALLAAGGFEVEQLTVAPDRHDKDSTAGTTPALH
jgi:biotin synthase